MLLLFVPRKFVRRNLYSDENMINFKIISKHLNVGLSPPFTTILPKKNLSRVLSVCECCSPEPYWFTMLTLNCFLHSQFKRREEEKRYRNGFKSMLNVMFDCLFHSTKETCKHWTLYSAHFCKLFAWRLAEWTHSIFNFSFHMRFAVKFVRKKIHTHLFH